MIGITADTTDAGTRWTTASSEPLLFLPLRYHASVEQAGGAPLVLPSTRSKSTLRRYLDTIEGLVISGGDFDIHPHHYGEKASKELGRLTPERTEFELELTRLALGRDLPVLGICGGAQAINVALGGSLYQDLATQLPTAAKHQQSAGKSSGGHRVQVTKRTLLYSVVGCPSLEVNTTHHQAVKKAGKGLIINAAAEDGVIEGIESVRHSFVIGVQWHPERLMRRQPAQRRLFFSFLASCRRYRRRA